jgi:hypothetical protein
MQNIVKTDFNDGAVYLAVIDILDHAFAKLGLDRAELLPLRRISMLSFPRRCRTAQL